MIDPCDHHDRCHQIPSPSSLGRGGSSTSRLRPLAFHRAQQVRAIETTRPGLCQVEAFLVEEREEHVGVLLQGRDGFSGTSN
jgi:hypothetical protein